MIAKRCPEHAPRNREADKELGLVDRVVGPRTVHALDDERPEEWNWFFRPGRVRPRAALPRSWCLTDRETRSLQSRRRLHGALVMSAAHRDDSHEAWAAVVPNWLNLDDGAAE
jgi:hypothetical protein